LSISILRPQFSDESFGVLAAVYQETEVSGWKYSIGKWKKKKEKEGNIY
jgi:hypothetical protein